MNKYSTKCIYTQTNNSIPIDSQDLIRWAEACGSTTCGSSEKNCWGWEGVSIFRSVVVYIAKVKLHKRTEYTRREYQNKARIGQKHSVSFNIFIIKGINLITIVQYRYMYIGYFRVLVQCAYFFAKKAMYINFYVLFPSGMSIPIGSSKLH